MKLLFMQFPPASRYLLLLNQNIHLSTLFSNIHHLPLEWETKFHTHIKEDVKLLHLDYDLYDMEKQDILDWIIIGIPRI
jgi:hypothetical protein